MKTTRAKGLSLSKLLLQLNNMQRQNGAGSPAQMFWGRFVREGGVPILGRSEVDQPKLAKIRMQMREWDRTREEKAYKGDTTFFDVGDSVRYFTDGEWREVGEVVQTRTNSSDTAHLYHIKTSEGKIVLRPRKYVRVLKIRALRMARKPHIAAIKMVRFVTAADKSREQGCQQF